MPIKALLLLHSGFEEIEAVAPIDLLRRSGIDIQTASIETALDVKSKGSIWIRADQFFETLKEELFDAILLPGGPGIAKIRNNPKIESFILNHYHQNKCIACICAAPLILYDLGLHATHAMTAHPSVANTIDPLEAGDIVIDKNIITSKGAGTALAFALAIINYLKGSEKAKEIAQSICL